MEDFRSDFQQVSFLLPAGNSLPFLVLPEPEYQSAQSVPMLRVLLLCKGNQRNVSFEFFTMGFKERLQAWRAGFFLTLKQN